MILYLVELQFNNKIVYKIDCTVNVLDDLTAMNKSLYLDKQIMPSSKLLKSIKVTDDVAKIILSKLPIVLNKFSFTTKIQFIGSSTLYTGNLSLIKELLNKLVTISKLQVELDDMLPDAFLCNDQLAYKYKLIKKMLAYPF